MLTIRFLVLVLAFLAFAAASAGVPSRVALVPLGLALYILSLLIP